MNNDLRQRIFRIRGADQFNSIALEIFRYQSVSNPVYHAYITALGIESASIKSPQEIPFLPVSFFKEHKIITELPQTVFERGRRSTSAGRQEKDLMPGTAHRPPHAVFESSGTTGSATSRHYVSDLSIYEMSFQTGFRYFYGEPSDYFFATLLPSYEERSNSSLIYMMNNFIRSSKYSDSGFFNNDPVMLVRTLENARRSGKKCIFLGVSFALLDLAEKFSPDLAGITVIETGGMKGRRKEITRQELHTALKTGFNVETIHSEYGMTELLSQAWSKGEGLFFSPPWMKIFIRDPLDPLTLFEEPGRSGGINIIDLANINSCSFLSVGDIGKLHDDGGFEVLGRLDNSEVRGCNLLME
jgi:phenylacetate-coenzyme A ligase PaaK-like adenylate-forming protein